ncbi:hypothetical protein MBBA_2209 [Methanoculleus bourgensis]|jgi:hypothetical protein|uniref:hypothetical protein n=1 Tax=Methanoculleus bourgensis TaxID=83986 RepID=UPI0007BCC9AA|nr:hypothetical protein MBBA_2209 [Methanoculleus bourgensis]
MTLYIKTSAEGIQVAGAYRYLNMDGVWSITVQGPHNSKFLLIAETYNPDISVKLAESDNIGTIQYMQQQLIEFMRNASGAVLVVENSGTQFVPTN